MKMKNCAIIGAGNGGQSVACYLAIKGCNVRIFDISKETINALNQKGFLELEGVIEGKATIEMATTDISKAIENAEVIFVILPSIFHKSIAEKMAHYLKDGQIVVLNPNATLGPVEFKKTLDDYGCEADYVIAAVCNLIFACRLVEPGKIHIYGKKKYLSVAAYPSSENSIVEEKIGEYFPEYKFVKDIVHVGLDNMNAFVHPAPTILNTGRIESGVPFQYYCDGMTPYVAHYVEQLEKERLAIAKAYDVQIQTIPQLYHMMYETKGDTIEEVVRNCTGYFGVMAADSVDTRYVLEDVPCSLVALQTLANLAGIEAPAINTMIKLSQLLFEDKISEGRTIKNLGLENKTKEEFIKMCRSNCQNILI
ncbi:NAD/NADP octopine/nopaline dehydrogenase family protein [Romboutsia sp.]|uniref:NAD/NADP octopine/nopaline dehydrogenase family protein n=1 Tax=Romboutsia sp. TaxID=1965302 RepID=UPI002BFB458E|nr:NAD/NADP octopine/nopaline dehydrogenase family protein [Romboutsia sp.]HSQ89566.1 NAD/NADP octopine/nopaline dehydrogenase family protein [Romboutsia sp.]